jgi:dienelactone hydrolase
MEIRRVDLESFGVRGPAWEISPEAPPVAGAVLFHGYGSCKEAMLGLALALAEAGLACTVPDLPGHGEHPAPFGAEILDEARAAVEHARGRGASGAGGVTLPVVAVGQSMGGRLALLCGADAVVAISPALPAQPSPEGIYALRTFATPKVRQAYPGQVVEVLGGLPVHQASDVPVLVVVGVGDIPSIEKASEDLVASLPAAEITRVAEGMLLEAEEPPSGFGSYLKHWVNHSGLTAVHGVAREVVAWTGKHLPGPPAA